MALTTRQKAMGGILVLAAGAFAWDQAARGPASADAAASAGPDGGAASLLLVQPAPKPAAGATATASPATALQPLASSAEPQTLGSRIAEVAAGEDANPARCENAFALPDTWPAARRPNDSPGQPAQQPGTMEADRAAAEDFAHKHHLDAVMLGTEGNFAMVDGQIVPAGQLFDGFKLTSITKSTATFRRGRIELEIRLTPASPR